ncbi:MAG: hypothetical protein KGH74_03600 [Candidatus Micrarchaeota archaeon]|nr:hypothetical protein [Candidatus Micrarchaeota archaeon]
MTQIITLVGDLGGGKTTLASVLGMIVKTQIPDAAAVSNVKAPACVNVGDVHKFIAVKLIQKDKRYAFCLDDEAAQAGLESRGSFTKAAAIESRVITHARKAHIDLVLISQLKSMLDKRAQWVEDFSILCEAVFEQGNLTSMPNSFHYTVYDKYLEVLNEFDLDTMDMLRYVWPFMDTDDIPFFEAFKKQFEDYYSISEDDVAEWQRTMEIAIQQR